MLAIIIAALAPGLALLTFFYLKDRYQPEPLKMVIRLFIFGAIIGFPVMIIQYGIKTEVTNHIVFTSFISVGLLEEFFKWFIIYFLVYNHSEFDEAYDGIVYAVAVSLGFATLENFLYLMTEGLSIAIIRALLPVSGHALFGVIMGYYLGLAKFMPKRSSQIKMLMLSIMYPILIHGSYDLLIYSSQIYWLWTVIPFMVGLWWLALKRMHQSILNSKKDEIRKEFIEESR